MISKELKEQIQYAFQYFLDEAEGDNDRERKENAKNDLADNLRDLNGILDFELSDQDLERQENEFINIINMEL